MYIISIRGLCFIWKCELAAIDTHVDTNRCSRPGYVEYTEWDLTANGTEKMADFVKL